MKTSVTCSVDVEIKLMIDKKELSPTKIFHEGLRSLGLIQDGKILEVIENGLCKKPGRIPKGED